MIDFLDIPEMHVWSEREVYFDNLFDIDKDGMVGYMVSEQACALMIDLRLSFCAGAWISVIILSLSIIDAQLREIELPDYILDAQLRQVKSPGYKVNTAELIRITGLEKDLDWIRKRRNKLIHLDVDNPEISVDDQWFNRDIFESDARKAIELVSKVLFLSPWV
ncbi:MAG: hypothetical protein MdMp014T_2015 [Treponematales bacterium]